MKWSGIMMVTCAWLALPGTNGIVQHVVAQESEQKQNGKQKSQGQESEAVVNLGTTIIGNREQPKVLYIVPWKAVNASELADQTIESQLEVVFDHVEAAELRRELKYVKKLSSNSVSSEE